LAFINLPRDVFDTFSVIARPEREFSSSSLGITGSLPVFSRASSVEKLKITKSDESFFETDILPTGYGGEDLLKASASTEVSPRASKKLEIKRIVPEFTNLISSSPISFGNFFKKQSIRNSLYRHYFVAHPQIFWGFTNYNCIHFANITPSSSSIIYPSSGSTYIPTPDFTFEFYFKPSYTNLSGSDFDAGTLLHASSSFAISIVSGSQLDVNGSVESFRVMLQLSHSADVLPSEVDLTLQNNARTFPEDLIFLSNDNSLRKNAWNHIAIRWSPNQNQGTGSFVINSANAGEFYIPSGSVTTGSYESDAIFIGNFFEGVNTPSNRPAGFFNSSAVLNEGVSNPYGISANQPTGFQLRHPLVGETHDIKIWKSYRGIEQIISGSKQGASLEEDLLFYLPVFFLSNGIPRRRMLNTHLFDSDRISTASFNSNLSFSIGGHDISIENFLKEFVKGNSPRLLFLTSSTIGTFLSSGQKVNDILFQDDSFAKRNLTILPCDNGLFYPNFELQDVTKEIDLSDQINEVIQSSFDFLEPSPFSPNLEYKTFNYIFQNTGDESSNLVSIFNVSNLFYGEKIHPGSIEILDSSFTGSKDTLGIKLKDNQRGLLYRADAESPHATWSLVGSSFYQDGILCVTNPCLGDLFGKDNFSINLKGEKSVHVLETQVIAPSWTINSSSNPTFTKLKSSDYANDVDEGFVYINQINLHDDNLNVIAKAKMAQPIVKRPSDRILFRIKFDF